MRAVASRLPALPILASGAVLVAYLLPEWLALFMSRNYVYVNGWDEETYLSWQGVLGSMFEPGGYSVLALNWVLHRLNVSPAIQNLAYDTILPPLTVFLVARALAMLGVARERATSYAVLVAFSSVLFNYTDPLVKWLLGPYDGAALWMAGFDLYPSILRTPNPEVSYALVAAAVYCYLRWRKFWLLLLPVPLLYFYVAVPYLIGIVALVAFRRLGRQGGGAGVLLMVAAVGIAYLLAAVSFTALAALRGLYAADNPIRLNAYVFHESRMLQLPLGLGLLAVGAAIVRAAGWLRSGSADALRIWFLALLALASVNLHIVAGIMLSQKNYYDCGISVVLGLILVQFLEMVAVEPIRRRLATGLLALVALMVFASQLPFFVGSVRQGRNLDRVGAIVRTDPLHAVIPELPLSSYVAYSAARTLAPPFSYQYYFQFIEKQCALNETWMAAALAFAATRLEPSSAEMKALTATLDKVREGQRLTRSVPYANQPYCTASNFRPEGFFLVH